MRVPSQQTMQMHSRRRTIIISIAIVVLFVLLIVGQSAAGFYTNFLWFHSSGVGDVWSTIISSKVALAAIFITLAFALVFACLAIVKRVTERTLSLAPDTEFVRRYRAIVTPHALVFKIVISFLAGLALGAGTSGQWQHWLLFSHPVSFGRVDPVFGKDLSFFVFRLPFLSFLVDWMFSALVVAFVVSVIAYLLNGAIRVQPSFTIEPRTIAHLSILLALMALERAWAYFFVDRYTLDLSSNGFVCRGRATPTFTCDCPRWSCSRWSRSSLSSRSPSTSTSEPGRCRRSRSASGRSSRSWSTAIFPAIFQALRVTPAQSTLESTSIRRNIAAPDAMGIGQMQVHSFPANQDLSSTILHQYSQLLNDVQLWDPSYSYATFVQLQGEFDDYALDSLAVDRYVIGGRRSRSSSASEA